MIYSTCPSSVKILSPSPNKNKGHLYIYIGITCLELENITPYNYCLTIVDKDKKNRNDEFDPGLKAWIEQIS